MGSIVPRLKWVTASTLVSRGRVALSWVGIALHGKENSLALGFDW